MSIEGHYAGDMTSLTFLSYLNLNCESEGLYRVPGSGPQVKHWQRRFDSELDVDLLDEHELYDPNNIGSMLKSWLRDLPTEIFPKTLQHALAEELAKENPEYQKMGQPAPQKLRDALSDLPPFNYYLLFAITCHLSLLLSHKEKNKMDLNNLSICIGPPLDLERWLFNYLVGDWRHCWQGCFTEKQYLETEAVDDQGADVPPSAGQQESKVTNGSLKTALNERAVHSSSSNNSAPASRKGSQQGTTKQGTTKQGQGSYSSKDENSRPEKFRSASDQQINGGVAPLVPRKPVGTPIKRPATAGKSSDDEKSTTPKSIEHNRSRSEFAAIAPVKSQAPLDFQFDTRSQ